MNWTVKKKQNFVNSYQNEGLSPSCIALFFDRFGSMSWHSIWFSSDGSFSFHIFSLNYQLFRPEHHWRDLSSRNVHLVHQNCSRISFTSMALCFLKSLICIPPYYEIYHLSLSSHFSFSGSGYDLHVVYSPCFSP
jgi:hypothetical protein